MLPATLPKKFSCGAKGVAFPPVPSAGAEQSVLYSGCLFPGSELEWLILGMIAASPACSLALLKVLLCHLPCHKSETYVLSIDNKNTYRSRQGIASTPAPLPANALVLAVCGKDAVTGSTVFTGIPFVTTVISFPGHDIIVMWYLLSASLGFPSMRPDLLVSLLRFPCLYC